MVNRKTVTSLLAGCLASFAVTTSHGFEMFAADRFDEVVALPGSSLGAPSGMVSSWGSVFMALGGLTNTPGAIGTDSTDGSFSIGMGFGDALNGIGATVTLGIGSVNFDGGEGERGAFNVSIGTFFTGWQLGVAIGGLNVGGWNDLTTSPEPSPYFAITKILGFDNHPVVVNLGVGANAFANIAVFSDLTIVDPEAEIGGFIGIGIYITPQISFILDHTAGISSAGFSLTPVHDVPFVITLSGYDLEKVVPNHDKVSFVGSIAYSFSF